MRIAILGYAGQGKAAYEYWNCDGNEVVICDKNTDIDAPEGAKTRLGDDHLKNLDEFDLLVRTPILHPSKILDANPESPDILDKVTTVTNEFLRVCPTQNIIGVTGTKGKGTTSTMIAQMLHAAGKRVHLGGNIGIAPLELLKGAGALDKKVSDILPDDWVVLELANFQLIDLKYSPHIAVCLMIEAEHLDWHADMEEYIAAKQQLFIWQEPDDKAVYFEQNANSKRVAAAGKGVKISYFQEPGALVKNGTICIEDQVICATNELKLLGEHNWQNVCAAVTAVWQIEQNIPAMRKVLKSFGGLPFRIELRREVDGIKYYDDSFATASGATIAAIEAIQEKKVLILGGFDRGLSLEKLADSLKKYERDIRKVILVGAAAGRLKEMLEQKGFYNYVEESSRNMDAIVRRARDFAHQGDAVVLSPAFASFDMFKNFEDRGRQFNEAVDKL